jgi:hypothetical protein
LRKVVWLGLEHGTESMNPQKNIIYITGECSTTVTNYLHNPKLGNIKYIKKIKSHKEL